MNVDNLTYFGIFTYRYMPLHFNAFQRMMQIEEEHVANLQYGDTFRKQVFNTDGDLLVIDMGCGPMTAGVALADWYQSKEHKPLGLSYIGVDDAEHCRNFAESFANRNELFAMQNPPVFRADCSEVDVNELKNFVTQNGTLLFIFSYVFGQDTCKEEHLEKWALFVRQVMTTCNAKHNLVAYMNSPPYPDRENPGQYIDPNMKYAQFCQLLGWRDRELKYKTGTDYQYPQSFLGGFNEPHGIIAARPSQQSFRHVLVDARLVDKQGIPIREDRKRP